MLENKYHFEFPQLYKTLLEDRMFDYTAPQYLLNYKFYGADLEPFSFEESLHNYEDFPFYALVLADNLEDFIFYKMLMAAFKVDDECDDETFKAELQRVLSTHKKYLKKEYVKVLEQLYDGPIAKLSDCDLEKLYIKETAFTRFDEELYCGEF